MAHFLGTLHKMKPDLSMIVPAFNCPTIKVDLTRLDRFLKTLNISYEILCVVDGKKSTKDKTLENAKSLRLKKLSVYSYPENKGKGYAVRFGFKQANGDIIGFFDAGSDIKVENIKSALEIFKANNADIVVGSKRHPASHIKNYPSQRKFLSLLAQISPRLLLGIKVPDTQVGLKLFDRRVINKILPKLSINGFAFDLEILKQANISGFHKVHEAPVDVTYNHQSTIRLTSLLDFLADYLRILFK